MNSKSTKNNFKLISIVLIISILLQLLMPIVIPLKSFAADEEDYVIKTQFNQIIKFTSKVHEMKAGDIVPVEIEVTGNKLISLSVNMIYDKSIFEIINVEYYEDQAKNIRWQEAGFTEQGEEGQFIYARSYGEKETSGTFVAMTINLKVKETVEGILDSANLQFIYVIPEDSVNGTDGGPAGDGNGYQKEVTLPVPVNTCDIKYDANVQEGESSTVTDLPDTGKKNEGEPYTIAAAPKRTGYRFMGWNTSADGNGGTYLPGSLYTTDLPMTLYAQWKEVLIKYEANAETDTVENLPQEGKKTEDTYTISPDVPTREGFSFKEWNTVADGTGIAYKPGSLYAVDENLTLYAQWDEVTSSAITYEENATDVINMPEDGTKQPGEEYTISEKVPTKDGYIFKGWSTTADGSGAIYQPGSKYTVDVPLTLYAQWEELKITYDKNASVEVADMPTTETTVQEGNYTIPENVPTRQDGYKFVEWNTATDGTGVSYRPGKTFVATEKLILYAQWEKIIPATIKYEGNAPEGETVEQVPAEDTKTPGEEYTISEEVPTRTGYKFISWNTEANGKGAIYQPGSKYTADEDLTLYAQWEELKITYDANSSGVAVSNMPQGETIAQDGNYVIPEDVPTRADGYEFICWNTQTDGKGKVYEPGKTYTAEGKMTLYAQWEKITPATIKYEGNVPEGETVGSIPAEDTKTKGEDYIIPENVPTRTGYKFMGWNTQADGKGATYQSGSKYTRDEDLTLYAQWEELKITYDQNAEGVTVVDMPESETIAQGQNYTISEKVPTREDGYEFICWNTQADGKGATYETGKTYPANEKLTLYAQWEKVTPATITYQKNVPDTETVENMPDNATKTKGQDYTIDAKVPTREGYKFMGWNTADNGSGITYQSGNVYSEDKDLTLFAQWKKAAIIKFEANVSQGETVESMPDPIQVVKEVGVVYQIPTAEPTREGWIFKGWNTVADGSGITYKAGNSYNADEDLTLFAQWQKEAITTIDIVYNANVPEEDKDKVQGMPQNGTKEEGKDYTIAAAPTREGYEFIGWNTTIAGNGGSYQPGNLYKIDADLTLYAQWREIKAINITYNANVPEEDEDKVEGMPANETKEEGKDYTIAVAPTREGYEFIGWCMTADGKGATYQPGNLYKVDEDLELFAQWKEVKTINIIYNANVPEEEKDTVKEMPQNGTKAEGEEYTIAAAPTREGYEFLGWNMASDGSQAMYNPGNLYTADEDLELFAQWREINVIKITYSANVPEAEKDTVENLPEEATKEIGKDYIIAAAPTREGYKFIGWSIVADGNGATYQPGHLYKTDEDLELFAQWEEITTSDIEIVYNANVPEAEENTVKEMPENGTKSEGETYTIAAAPKREGYKFTGWNMSKNGDEAEYQPGSLYKTDANLTLYAQWEKEYTLTIDPNEGTYTGDTEITGINEDVEQIGTPTAPKGYVVTFDMNYETGSSVRVEQTQTFEKWEKVSGEGQVNGNVFTFGQGDAEIKAIYKLDEVNIDTPIRAGYEFKGWYTNTDPEQGEKVDLPFVPEEDMTLYADWEKEPEGEVEFTLTIEPNGGTYVGETERKGTPNSTIQIGTPAEAPKGHKVVINSNNGTTPTEVQQTQSFDKWEVTQGTGTVSGTAFTFVESNAKVTAKYKYDKVDLGKPTKEGYELEGWYTSSTLNPDTKIDPDNYVPTKDETVYANWKEKEYKIIYNNLKDSDNSQNPVKYTVKDQTIEFKDLLDKEGYIFKGWYLTEDGTGDKITSIDIADLEKMEDIVLFAKWEEKEPPLEEKLYLKSAKYKVGEKDIDNYEKGDVYLDKIEPETTVAKLKQNCEHNGTLTVINAQGQALEDGDLVGTDMTIKVEGHNDKIELTTVVMDDLDGNGKVTATDLSAVNQAILKDITLEGAAFKAADLDDNQKVTATDLSTINNVILKNIVLTFIKIIK